MITTHATFIVLSEQVAGPGNRSTSLGGSGPAPVLRPVAGGFAGALTRAGWVRPVVQRRMV